MIEMVAHVENYGAEFTAKKNQIQFRYRYDQSISICDSKTGAIQDTFRYSENVDFQQSHRGFVVVRKPLGPVLDNGILAPRVNPFGFVYAVNSNYAFEFRTTGVAGDLHIVDTKMFLTEKDRATSRKAEDLMGTVDPIRHYHLYDDKGRVQFANPKENRIISVARDGPIATFELESNYFKTVPIISVGKYDTDCDYALVSSEQTVAVAPGVSRVYGLKCEYKNVKGYAIPSKFTANTFFQGMGGEGRFVEMSETKIFEKFELSDSVDEREFSSP